MDGAIPYRIFLKVIFPLHIQVQTLYYRIWMVPGHCRPVDSTKQTTQGRGWIGQIFTGGIFPDIDCSLDILSVILWRSRVWGERNIYSREHISCCTGFRLFPFIVLSYSTPIIMFPCNKLEYTLALTSIWIKYDHLPILVDRMCIFNPKHLMLKHNQRAICRITIEAYVICRVLQRELPLFNVINMTGAGAWTKHMAMETTKSYCMITYVDPVRSLDIAWHSRSVNHYSCTIYNVNY